MTQLIGHFRIGKDAIVNYLDDGTPVTNLSLAYNYGRKGDDGNRPTQWVDGTLWGNSAENLAQYLLAGQGVCATIDDVHIEIYTRGDGGSGSKLTGKVSKIELVGGSPQSRQGGGQGQQQAPRQQQRPQGNGGGQRPPQRAQGGQRPPQRAQQPQRQHPTPAGGAGSGFDDMDDDIPFASNSMSYDMQTTKSKSLARGNY